MHWHGRKSGSNDAREEKRRRTIKCGDASKKRRQIFSGKYTGGGSLTIIALLPSATPRLKADLVITKKT
ncbi:hypothetical protein ACTXT7_013321 [Hymenolepis weldensis]